MSGLGSRKTWLLARVAVYLAIVLVLFVLRGGGDLSSVMSWLWPTGGAASSLTLAGGDLAPALIPRLVEGYGRDYGDVETRLAGGGTTHALEDLLRERADVAFLWRSPDAREQALFASTGGDSVLAFPVALGAIVVVCAASAPVATLSPSELAAIARAEPAQGVMRLYVADPNTGLWDALTATLGLDRANGRGVVFLADDETVFEATANDPNALGVVSDLAVGTPDRAVLRVIPVRGASDDTSSLPTPEHIASGRYPLSHYLYVSCRAHGPGAATKFVTHLTSRRGQRLVERAGYLPARHVARTVVLSRESLSSWAR